LDREGAAHYHDGPGNPHALDADALTAWRAGRILQTQWTRLLDSLQQAGPGPAATPVDLLGFSRGAALARDFANRISDHTQAGWTADSRRVPARQSPTWHSCAFPAERRWRAILPTASWITPRRAGACWMTRCAAASAPALRLASSACSIRWRSSSCRARTTR